MRVSQAQQTQQAPLLNPLRRQLHAELSTIIQQVETSDLKDELSQDILNWALGFKNALKLNCEEQQVYESYLSVIKLLLTDPLEFIPFDDDTYLGSDGVAYAHKSLSLHLARTPRPFKYRSPLHPDREALFTTVPHTNIRSVLDWLKRRQITLITPEQTAVNDAYDHLESKPTIPTLSNQRIRLIREKDAERRSQRAQSFENLRDEMREEIRAQFAEVRQEAAEFRESTDERFDRMRESDERRTRNINARLRKLQEDLNAFRESCETIRNEMSYVQRETDACDVDNLKLKQAIVEAKQAAAERQESQLGSLLSACAIVGACVCLSAVFPAGAGVAPSIATTGGETASGVFATLSMAI